MPLQVSEFSWSQTDCSVHISVPLKGHKAQRVDVVCTDLYLKVHFPPYLLEVFFFEPIDEDRTSVRFRDGSALFTLPKRNNTEWQQLMISTDDKERRKEIRQQALQKHQEKLSSESKHKAERQQADRKYALQSAMKLEEEERENIKRIKDEERQRTSDELKVWKQKNQEKTKMQTRSGSGSRDKEKPAGSHGRNPNPGGKLPPVRVSKNIMVSFTPRVFPTACRESMMEQEQEWLHRQAEARRPATMDLHALEDLPENHRNPVWLKDKGDGCFLSEDFLGAVNAYSFALSLNNKLPEVFSNRAAAHLKLRNLHKAISDASQALSLLTPPVPANAASRVRASIRRGTAFCELQLYAEGLQDYEAALKIQPDNKDLQEDVEKIRNITNNQGTGDSSPLLSHT
ncbi:dynein axonemal assembly factor 4 isoform X2 [Gouania willdenowi]|uniref:Dynein axonemal assembly factor 4 n=1 Tax=Gouania willdenowi TaxID=441366 RepID=A0A8C5I1I7_GOUWI|nr:dynein assembly factor 4, axonemal isoform X2 [Gouania willdenowi]